MKVTIKPNNLAGNVIVPPSKSLSHRAIIAACLAEGESIISNVLYSEDIKATIKAMRACGASITEHEDYLIIRGSKVVRKENMINANESGSTIRFMIPIALTCDEPITFMGENNLVNRPLNTYTRIFDEQKINYDKGESHLPLKVYNGLKSGVFSIEGNISSQFITGLLYALPLLKGDSKIVITTPLESKGYVDLTLDMLNKFGIKIENNDYKEFYVKGNQTYSPFNYEVEGDYSQSAFWLVADMLGSNINLLRMSENSFQGDKKIIQDIKDFGGDVVFKDGKLKAEAKRLLPATIDFAQSPDLGPALTVLAALTSGETHFINASRLRIKECDRISCMKEELEKLGAKITELPDGMIITGVSKFKGANNLNAHNDHRVMMSLAIASIACDGEIVIDGAECVKKSYPHFFTQFASLGGIVEYEK